MKLKHFFHKNDFKTNFIVLNEKTNKYKSWYHNDLK